MCGLKMAQWWSSMLLKAVTLFHAVSLFNENAYCRMVGGRSEFMVKEMGYCRVIGTCLQLSGTA